MNYFKLIPLIFIVSFGLQATPRTLNTKTNNDTLFEKQWGLENVGQTIFRRSNELIQKEVDGILGVDINWVSIKDLPFGKQVPEDREIVVAVLDSGLDVDHPDLLGRIHFDHKLCPEGEDNSNKPCSGVNILNKSRDLTDDMGHGTHVAGIIAATANNNLGIAGLADKRIKILPIKVLSKDVNEFVYNNRMITDIFADGIYFAVQRGAHVINMSIGWPKVIETPKIRRAFEYAAENNVVVIAAAGNNNKEIPTFPCTNESVICVGAVDNQGKITEFSNYGGKVDLLAPGEFIVSTYPQESVESRILRIKGYESKNGTSQASPFVAGIAASLKLLNPEMTTNELKARLFSSTRNNGDSKLAGKFTKYGMVDMKKTLMERPEKFAMPIYKGLLDLNFDNKTGKFFFSLPIKSLVGDFKDLKVTASFSRSDITLDSPIQKLDLNPGQKSALLFKGHLKDLTKDTHFRLSVSLESDGFFSQTETTLIFARNLSREDSLTKEVIEGFKASELTYFRGTRKVVRMKLIEDKEEWSSSPQFYIEEPGLQTEESTILSIVVKDKKKWTRKNIELDKKHEVVSVRISDLNGDQEPDYLVTSVNKEQSRITFDYLLFDKGTEKKRLTFNFPLLDYDNFPIEYSDLGETHLVALPYDLGLLKVPSFFTTYTMPGADNTTDILERIPEEYRAPHLYYLNPLQKDGELQFELRVVDSSKEMDSIRLEQQVEAWLPLTFEEPFPQSISDLRAGVLRGLVNKGEEFDRTYYSYAVNNLNVKLEPVYFPDRFISGNTVRSLLSLNNSSKGSPLGKLEFLAQLNRSQVRSYVWNPKSQEGKALLLDTDNWSDPIFNMVAGFDDKEGTRFIETRYYLQYFSNSGANKRLRINRESSFPGVRFSETLNPIVVTGEGENHPGIFINSTLIFGNRLYSMVKKDGEFLRPLVLSVDIPDNCVHLRPGKVDGVFNYLMLCRVNDGAIEFQRLPLVLP